LRTVSNQNTPITTTATADPSLPVSFSSTLTSNLNNASDQCEAAGSSVLSSDGVLTFHWHIIKLEIAPSNLEQFFSLYIYYIVTGSVRLLKYTSHVAASP